MADVVSDAVLGANALKQITNSSFDEGLETLIGRASGGVNPSDHFIESGKPISQLTSTDIGGFITAFGVTGSRITDGTTVQVPWQKRASGASFAGASANVQVAGNTACPVQLIPRSISAPRKGTPTAQGEVMFLSSNGDLIPHLITVNNTLSAQAFVKMYGLSKILINGTPVPQHVGFNVNFGVGLSEEQHYNGRVWPVDCFIETNDPTIEVMFEDFDTMASFTGGLAITTVAAYLQKRTTGGTYVDPTSLLHCKFSFAAGIITPKQMSAQDTKHGQASLLLTGRTLVASNVQAIP